MPKGPIIRKSDWGRKCKRLHLIMEKFKDEALPVMTKLFDPSDGLCKDVAWGSEVPSPEELRAARDRLVAYVREGMFGRKDMELEIASLAAVVWFMRLEADRKSRILNSW